MTPRLVLALVRRGGVALLAACALGWWTFYTDKENRAERAATDQLYRGELKEIDREMADALRRVAANCARRCPPCPK